MLLEQITPLKVDDIDRVELVEIELWTFTSHASRISIDCRLCPQRTRPMKNTAFGGCRMFMVSLPLPHLFFDGFA